MLKIKGALTFISFYFKIFDFLSPTLAELDIAYADGWSLWTPFRFNLSYSELFLKYWPKMTLGKVDMKLFIRASNF